MITNGTVVSDALKYVNGKAEKLDESSRKVGTFEEEEEEVSKPVYKQSEDGGI